MTKAVQDLMVDVARVRDAFHAALWTGPDPTALLPLAADGCGLSVLPAGVTVQGADAVARFLTDDLVRPADLAFERVTRTGDRWRVVDEDVVRFVHDRELPWLLPGVAATHRAVEVLVVALVTVRASRVTRYRALWDRTTLLDQLGADDRIGSASGRPG